MEKEHYGTVIIGAGQAGLSAAYYLKRVGAKVIELNKAPDQCVSRDAALVVNHIKMAKAQ